MKIMSWTTYNKKYSPERRTVQDGTLGFTYRVEPTMIYAGFFHVLFPVSHTLHGVPLGINDSIPYKKQVAEWAKTQEYGSFDTVVYHVWKIRGESTKMIDLYLK